MRQGRSDRIVREMLDRAAEVLTRMAKKDSFSYSTEFTAAKANRA